MKTQYPPPKRRWLPEKGTLETWADYQPWYQQLLDRSLDSVEALQAWIFDRGELDALVSGHGSRLYVAMARHSDDREAEQAFQRFQEDVLPQVKTISDRLDRHFLASPAYSELPSDSWQVYCRDTELGVRLFRPENVALETEEQLLAMEYGRLTGAMTVDFQGRNHTLPALAKYSEDRDRGVREQAWRLAAGRRLQDREALEELFEKLMKLRHQVALNADFPNFRDYQHEAKGRFDYRPEDCLALHDHIAEFVLPLAEAMQERRRRLLDLDTLRPWDFSVDPEGRPPFEPFQDQAGQVKVAEQVLQAIHPPFAADLQWMAQQDLLDLATRPNKHPGGFMDTFEDSRQPFIFSNSGTTHGDVETLIHESGHAIHALQSRHLEPVDYRSSPLEFAEVASMAMEAMAMEHYHQVYPQEEARRAVLDSLESLVRGLAWVATIDAFQHWLYLHPDHDRQARRETWISLRERFQPGVDWSGLEQERAYGWQAQLHLYEVPFYYVEYAIAQIGALQVWQRYRRDPQAGIADYLHGLQRGGSRPLPELFQAAGLRFDPRGEMLPELMQELGDFWRQLQEQP